MRAPSSPFQRLFVPSLWIAATLAACHDPYASNAGGGASDGFGEDADTGTDTEGVEPECDGFCGSGGRHQWTWRSGGSGSDRPTGLVVGREDAIFASFTIGRSTYDADLLLARLDGDDGEEVWTELEADGASNGLALAGNGDGLVSAGEYVALGVDARDGRTLPPVELGSPGRMLRSTIVSGPEGAYVFEALGDDFEFEITVHEVGAEGLIRSVAIAPYEIVDAVVDSRGHLFIAAVDELESDGSLGASSRGLILELNADLQVVRERELPGLPRRIASGPSGTLVVHGAAGDDGAAGGDGVCGRSGGVLRMYSFGATMTEQWTECTDARSLEALAVGPDGDVVLAYDGYDHTLETFRDWTELVVLQKIGRDGTRLWQREFAVDGMDTTASRLVIDDDNEIFLAGGYLAGVSDTSLLGDDTDVFVAKFSP